MSLHTPPQFCVNFSKTNDKNVRKTAIVCRFLCLNYGEDEA